MNPDDYRVAVYIHVPPYGWWTKPYLAQPLTPIAGDGTWICDITTGGSDQCATEIVAFLVPNGYDPPLGTGQECLSSEIYEYPYAQATRCKKISFSGYDWWVKRSCDRVGPGPNYFSDSEENVWVDPNGYLHLRIAQRDGKWYCSEVIADVNLGHGKYIFAVKGRVDLLDPNTIVGLFTWEDCVPEHHYREIDIELSRWGQTANNNGQFVVQPWNDPQNMFRFNVDCSERDTTSHVFAWTQDEVSFQSYYGPFSPAPPMQDMIASWRYTGDDTPPPGGENPRVNFWLMNGNPPTDGQDAEVVVTSFQYLPVRMLTAGAVIRSPNTGHLMLVFGYDDGTLEFRDWQGTLLQVRYGFGEITSVESYRFGSTPLPRLFVSSTDSGGALRIIDPANINNDVAARFGFGRVTGLWPWWPWGDDCLYVGSTDSGGTLRKLNRATLADEDVRYGFGEITAIWDAWDTTGSYLLVASTDSGGTMRCLNKETLADARPPRYGFGRIYDFGTGNADQDGNSEIVIASSDSGGTIRFVEAPNLSTDLAVRYGFGTIYGVDYGPAGVTQCDNEGLPGSKVSIVVGSSDGGGTVRRMEVDADTLATTLADSVLPRSGFGTIGVLALPDICLTDVELITVFSTDGGTCAAHIMDENLADLTSFAIP